MLKLALAILISAATFTAYAEMIPTVAMPAGWDPLQHKDITDCLGSLVAESRFGTGDEQAAFIVLQDDGRFSCVRWRDNRGARHAVRYKGRIPQGTVAVAHTHPRDLSNPSQQDKREADRLDVPFLVVTMGKVTMARPGQEGIVDLGTHVVSHRATASSEISQSRP